MCTDTAASRPPTAVLFGVRSLGTRLLSVPNLSQMRLAPGGHAGHTLRHFARFGGVARR